MTLKITAEATWGVKINLHQIHLEYEHIPEVDRGFVTWKFCMEKTSLARIKQYLCPEIPKLLKYSTPDYTLILSGPHCDLSWAEVTQGTSQILLENSGEASKHHLCEDSAQHLAELTPQLRQSFVGSALSDPQHNQPLSTPETRIWALPGHCRRTRKHKILLLFLISS